MGASGHDPLVDAFLAKGFPAVSPALLRLLGKQGSRDPARREAQAYQLLASRLQRAGQVDHALACLEASLTRYPREPEVWGALAGIFLQRGQYAAAEMGFQQGLQFAPDDPRLLQALGTARLHDGRPREALAPLRKAVERQPSYTEAWRNLAAALQPLGEVDEALRCLRRALQVDPADPDTRWNLALNLLLQGRWQEGWSEYEARHRVVGMSRPALPALPRWAGEPSKRLIVYAEQGLGDVLQFARYLPALRARAEHVTLFGPRALGPLFADTPGIDRYVSALDGLAGDALVPLLSLPQLLGLPEPRAVPPLAPRGAQGLVAHWRPRVRALGGRVVGLCWQGNPGYRADRARSVALAHFVPILSDPDIAALSLQRVHGREQMAGLPGEARLCDWGDEVDGAHGPFVDTAAILQSLDALVCSDSAVAHLAGSLGVRTFLLLPAVPDWRWGLQGNECPWYPSVELLRQSAPGDWGPVVAGVHRRLLAIAPGP